jgi:protein-tyrosine phosphatase
MKKILFICTGNYYRSRFAEALVNYYAPQKATEWRAFSRGLAIWMAEGKISPFTRSALAARNIPESYCGDQRTSLQESDLLKADRIIALDKEEHYSMMLEQFPNWADRISYWTYRDIQWDSPDNVILQIEEAVSLLLDELGNS